MTDISPKESQIQPESPQSDNSGRGNSTAEVQPLTNPAPKTPDQIRAERKERIAEFQKRRPLSPEEQKNLGGYVLPDYPVIIGQRVATKGGLKKR